MASYAEIEELVLALPERERATLAATLIASLPDHARNDASAAGKFLTVRSSMLDRVRYDPKKRLLDVVFKTGEKYRYQDVPLDEYNGLMNAKSLGKYMQTHIIDLFETVKLEN